jgi:hypothetical protein
MRYIPRHKNARKFYSLTFNLLYHMPLFQDDWPTIAVFTG